MGPGCIGCPAAIVQDGLDIARLQLLADPASERIDITGVTHPGASPHAAEDIAQVVGEAAGAHQQYPFGRQRRQGLPQRESAGRVGPGRHGDLHHGHLGLGQQVHEGHPGAVVQPLLRVQAHGHPRTRQDLGGQARHFRCARRRIAQAVKLVGKAAEVVNGLGLRASRDLDLEIRRPVGRQHEHGQQRRQAASQLGQQRTCLAGAHGKHRGSVRDEQAGQWRPGYGRHFRRPVCLWGMGRRVHGCQWPVSQAKRTRNSSAMIQVSG